MKHVSSLEHLRDLELRGLCHVTSLGVEAIAFGCQRLSELDLKRCNLLGDAGLFALAQHTENLRQVSGLSSQFFLFFWILRKSVKPK